MKDILNAFYKSGLAMEFFETLINDKSIPEQLRRKVWSMCSTTFPQRVVVIPRVADEFADSTDELDLIARWERVVELYWPYFPECPLKWEIEERTPEVEL